MAATVCSIASPRPNSPSPSPGNAPAIHSPGTLLPHHSPPARSAAAAKAKSRPQHVTIIDERTATTSKGLTLSASQNQLVATLAAAARNSPPTPPALLASPSAAVDHHDGGGAVGAPPPTGQLALLYHHTSSQHHHHHLHPILPVVARRPSRLPETVYVTRPQEIRA